MEALDLHVEERVGRHIDAALVFDDRGEVLFIGALDRHELLLESLLAGEFFQAAQDVEIARPNGGRAKLRRDERGQARVAIQQPAARRDPVGLVLEFAGIKRVEVREQVLLQELGVERGDTVDRM